VFREWYEKKGFHRKETRQVRIAEVCGPRDGNNHSEGCVTKEGTALQGLSGSTVQQSN
jgi:hypothetical protein